jgi:hypothetical protein
MSTEQPTKTGTLKIIVDSSPREEEYKKIIAEKDELIKTMLVNEKEKFFAENTNHLGLKNAPVGGESAPLEAPQKPEIQLIDMEGSFIPQDFVYGKNPIDVLQKIELISKSKAENADEYAKILSKIAKKSFSGQKALDITFIGDNVLFNRSKQPVREYATAEEKLRVARSNIKLDKNRTNWKVN